MELKWYKEQGIAIIVIRGELDATNNEHVQELVNQLLAQGHRQFVVDLTHVEFIDSAGLVMLVRCLKHIRSGTGDIYLAHLQSEVLCVLQLTRLDRVFECFPDLEAAVQRFLDK